MKSLTFCLLVTSCVLLYATFTSGQETSEVSADKSNPMQVAIEKGKDFLEKGKDMMSKSFGGRKKREADDESESSESDESDSTESDETTESPADKSNPMQDAIKKGKDMMSKAFGGRKKREADVDETEEAGSEKKAKGKAKGKCHGHHKNKVNKDSDGNQASSSPSDPMKDALNKGKAALDSLFNGRKKRQVPSLPSQPTDNEEDSEESSEEESENEEESSRKKRLVNYNIRETIEQKYLVI
jgi:hypothetical protein